MIYTYIYPSSVNISPYIYSRQHGTLISPPRVENGSTCALKSSSVHCPSLLAADQSIHQLHLHCISIVVVLATCYHQPTTS